MYHLKAAHTTFIQGFFLRTRKKWCRHVSKHIEQKATVT